MPIATRLGVPVRSSVVAALRSGESKSLQASRVRLEATRAATVMAFVRAAQIFRSEVMVRTPSQW